ncbi:MAG: o-succinylbenzoate synthase [Crocinitomicaceae bacterium]
MYRASLEKYTLKFKRPSGTSRGILTEKDSWFVRIWHQNDSKKVGIGEASIIKTLSPDWSDHYEEFLSGVVNNINHYVDKGLEELRPFPSIYFAIETALLDLKNGGRQLLFRSPFTENRSSIRINGLIWMGEQEFMLQQIREKINQGFSCIKMKIGAIDFEKELELLAFIRKHYNANKIELRVDANGAFSPDDAMDKLKALAAYDLHSIEQPIKQGQIEAMAALCAETPLPIALDEELIGINAPKDKIDLLERIKPQYIILKPSLVGGFKGTNEWIAAAEALDIDWWITSALESNIGLNAIAQYTYTKENPLPQGLGTGQLYTNNIPSPLVIREGMLLLD